MRLNREGTVDHVQPAKFTLQNPSSSSSQLTSTVTFNPPSPRDRRLKGGPPNKSISGLERKYRETLGEIKKLREEELDWQGFDGFEQADATYKRRLKQLNDQLVAIEQSIRLFDPDWLRKRHMAPLARRSSPLLSKGVFRKALLKILREAQQPLTVANIAENVARELILPMGTRAERQKMWQTTYNALRSLEARKSVTCLCSSPSLWLLGLKSH